MERDGAIKLDWCNNNQTGERWFRIYYGFCCYDDGCLIVYRKGDYIKIPDDPYNKMMEFTRRIVLPN